MEAWKVLGAAVGFPAVLAGAYMFHQYHRGLTQQHHVEQQVQVIQGQITQAELLGQTDKVKALTAQLEVLSPKQAKAEARVEAADQRLTNFENQQIKASGYEAKSDDGKVDLDAALRKAPK